MLFRADREAPVAPPSVAKVGPTSVSAARRSDDVQVVDGRTDFRSLLAELRAQSEAGADCWQRLRGIAKTRPALAIDLALALDGDNDERAHWVTELTRTWAGHDAQAAWAWLGPQMPRMEPVTGNSLIGVVLNAMAAQAPLRVIDNVDALLRRGNSDGAMPALVACQDGLTALVAHGYLDVAQAAVEEWGQNPRAQAIDASAFNVVAGAIAQNSWTEAGAWLETLPPSIERNSASAVLASKWADHDPVAALTWAETLGADNGQFGAIRSVFADWVERDGSRAGDWLMSYIDRAKSESEIDQLLSSFVTFSNGLQRDPAHALSWTELVRDSAQRDALAERVIMRWGRRDLAAATQYVDSASQLSIPQRQKLKANLLARAADLESVDD